MCVQNKHYLLLLQLLFFKCPEGVVFRVCLPVSPGHMQVKYLGCLMFWTTTRQKSLYGRENTHSQIKNVKFFLKEAGVIQLVVTAPLFYVAQPHYGCTKVEKNVLTLIDTIK